MTRALIGHTGFVGSNLTRSGRYDALYNSKNSHAMRGCRFTDVVCAGVSAVKWKANQNPEADWAQISDLIDNLKAIEADRFVLISTVDVYGNPNGVDESHEASETGGAYGVNRAKLEQFIKDKFRDYLIIRLPALYGAGLKKNAIYDLRHDNMVDKINPLSEFQWYDVRRLEADIATIRQQDLKLINIAAEPVSMKAIGDRYFSGKLREPDPAETSMRYDMWTRHAPVLGGTGNYHFSRSQVLDGIGNYLEQEI